MKFSKIATKIAVELIRKSGVREFDDDEFRVRVINAALEFAYAFSNFPGSPGGPMAITATFRQQVGTAKVFKSSGGDSAITTASLANGSGRQSVKLDLGATFAQRWRARAEVEMAATPTAGNTVDFYWAPSGSATAGTDNPGNVTGADAAYAGYSSNLTATIPQLIYIGSLVLTAQATTTVQKGEVGTFFPPARYGSLVVVNNGGSAFHSSDTSIRFEITPVEGTAEA